MAKTFIWVTFQRKGFHKFPAAATDPKFEDVSYLGNVHRHLFKFKVYIEVQHNDREIEFHQFLNWLEGLYDNGSLELDYKSVEMASDDLYNIIREKYPHREIWIDLSEDGECGSLKVYD